MKRENYIKWDEYFMGLALLSGKRSKDPNTQVGACIVKDNRVLSVGYNGMPFGCSDDEYPWGKSTDTLDTKESYVVHAELNAILNSGGTSLEGSRIFVSLFPCNNCAKAIIQSGIKEVVYLSDKYADQPTTQASRKMLTSAGVTLTQLIPTVDKIELSFNIKDI